MNATKSGLRWSMKTGALAAVVLASWLLPAVPARAQSRANPAPYPTVDARYFDRSIYFDGRMVQRPMATSMGRGHLSTLHPGAHPNRYTASTGAGGGRRGGGGGSGGGHHGAPLVPNSNVATIPSLSIPSLGVGTSHVSVMGHR
jgi:hypothetical protein